MRVPAIAVMREPEAAPTQRRRCLPSEALSGGGTSSPCSFSTLGGRLFPAGPSLRPGEMRTVEVFGFIQEVEHRWP
jgi:hypothetical protein